MGCGSQVESGWVPGGFQVASKWVPSQVQAGSSGNDCVHMHIHIERILLFVLHAYLYPRAIQMGEFSDELSEAAVAY